MEWQTIQDAIKTWFSNGTGLTCVWFNQPRPRMDKPIGLLQILSMSQYGNDMVQYEPNLVDGIPGSDYTPTVRGQRALVVTCQVISREQTAGADALYYLERARAYTAISNTQEALRAAGVSFWSMTDIRVHDALFDKRMESRASFDITFGVAENLEFSSADDGSSWIEHVEMSSDYSPNDDLNFTDEIFGYPI